jgi:CubicO group peptidase (beta-lactamase class C family)
MNEAAKEFMADGQTVGMSIGIVMQGQVAYYNFGSTAIGSHKTPSNRTRYFIASITKTFTGTLLAQAVIDRKLKLDDDVRTYLPEPFPNLQFNGEPIRMWELVNHRSGLPFNLPERTQPWLLPGWDPAKNVITESKELKAYSPEKFYNDLHKVKLPRVPGKEFSYSNAGAQLAGLILEQLYGKTYEQLLKNEITGPLGMRNTKILLSPTESAQLPKAYSQSGEFLPVVSDRLPAAGSIKSTAEDMVKYVRWEIGEKDPAVKISHTPPVGEAPEIGYYVGLNWQIVRSKGVRTLFQDGNVPGFHSMCVVYPELHLGMVVLTNGYDSFNPPSLSAFIGRILKTVDPRAAPTP